LESLAEAFQACTEARKEANIRANYGKAVERRRIKNLKATCEKRYAALTVRYDNLRHKVVKLEAPHNPVQVTADMEKQQKLVVKEMEEPLFWLDGAMKELTERDLRLLEMMDTTKAKV
jgi:hypothetical protein